jgi:hypothetical protein
VVVVASGEIPRAGTPFRCAGVHDRGIIRDLDGVLQFVADLPIKWFAKTATRVLSPCACMTNLIRADGFERLEPIMDRQAIDWGGRTRTDAQVHNEV